MISFAVNRAPYLPNPAMGHACEAKERILDFGGRFYKFTVNGCSTLQTLLQHLIVNHGLNRVVAEDALSKMLEATNETINGALMDNWLIDENIDGERDDSFAGFAFTEAELEMKTRLFLEGIQAMKSYLEEFTRQLGCKEVSADSVWTL